MSPFHAIACAALLLHAAADYPYDPDWREGVTQNGVALPPCHHAGNPANGFEIFFPPTGPVFVGTDPSRPWYACMGIGQVGTHAPGENRNALTGVVETTLNIDLVEGFLNYFYPDGNRFIMQNAREGFGLHLRAKNPAGRDKFLFVDFAITGDLHGTPEADPALVTLRDAKEDPVLQVRVLDILDVYQEKHPATQVLMGDRKVLRVSADTSALRFPVTIGIVLTAAK